MNHNRHKLSKREDTINYIFGGKAIITLQSKATNNHYTFKISSNKNKDVYFVSVLNGSDNIKSYMYLGTIFNKNEFRLTKKSPVDENATSVKGFRWFFDNLLKCNFNNLIKQLDIYHEGKCGVCGRKLTTPESIVRGIGKICFSKI